MKKAIVILLILGVIAVVFFMPKLKNYAEKRKIENQEIEKLDNFSKKVPVEKQATTVWSEIAKKKCQVLQKKHLYATYHESLERYAVSYYTGSNVPGTIIFFDDKEKCLDAFNFLNDLIDKENLDSSGSFSRRLHDLGYESDSSYSIVVTDSFYLLVFRPTVYTTTKDFDFPEDSPYKKVKTSEGLDELFSAKPIYKEKIFVEKIIDNDGKIIKAGIDAWGTVRYHKDFGYAAVITHMSRLNEDNHFAMFFKKKDDAIKKAKEWSEEVRTDRIGYYFTTDYERKHGFVSITWEIPNAKYGYAHAVYELVPMDGR